MKVGENMKKHRWINDNIVIDFKLPEKVKMLMNDLERMDEEEDYCYFDWAEHLECVTKEMYVIGKITKAQWDLICRKYEG